MDTVVAGAWWEDGGPGSPLSDSGAAYVFTLVNEPCARDDTFATPAGAPLTIPVGALLGNDAHSRGLPIYFSSHDAAPALGTAITSVGLPVTELRLPAPPPVPPSEDTFTYRITDGVREAAGTVHLVTVAISQAPTPNKLGFIPSPPIVRGLTLLFNAPAAGTYTLERKTIPLLGGNSVTSPWSPAAIAWPSGPGVIGFTDAMLPTGAMYRVRGGP